jgi:hypothetical protein
VVLVDAQTRTYKWFDGGLFKAIVFDEYVAQRAQLNIAVATYSLRDQLPRVKTQYALPAHANNCLNRMISNHLECGIHTRWTCSSFRTCSEWTST